LIQSLICLFGILVLAGCGGEPPQQKEVVGAKEPPPGPPPPPVLDQADLPYPRGGRVELSEEEQKPKLTERVKAKVGVGAKGRRLEDERLVQTIVTPAVALFRTRERTVFEIQIPKALQLYEALHGDKPQTHEEFFEQIIKANRIELPGLPKGHRYVYDPDKGQLMVQRPAQ
jgi:hypothetical protein